jgi:hypothetical protein
MKNKPLYPEIKTVEYMQKKLLEFGKKANFGIGENLQMNLKTKTNLKINLNH